MKARVLAAFLFAPVLASGQAISRPPGSPAQIEAQLLQIEREIGEANFKCDYRYFERVEGDDFVFTDPAGGLTNKKQDLAGEKNCRKVEGAYDLAETHVALYGGTAVVTARVTITTTDKDGKPVSRHSRFTDVFVWRDGRWQIVAGHSSRIPDQK
jgi:ketosteroid isomerase-like protein